MTNKFLNVDFKFFQIRIWKRNESFPFTGYGFCIRIFGYGFMITNSLILFSERNGYVKFYRLPFGYRLKFLKRTKRDRQDKSGE